MKLSYNSLIMGVGMAALISISSCKKNTELIQPDNETVLESAQVDEETSDTFSDLFLVSSQDLTLYDTPVNNNTLATNSTNTTDALSALGLNSSCRTVSISPIGNNFPKTVTIDYGTGCDDGGKIRKGKVISVFSGRFKESGTIINITFDNFYINGDKIEGTKTIVNNGRNNAGNFTFTITVNHTRTLASGGTVTHTSVKTIEWIEGVLNSPTDDIFSIRGSESGTDSRGRTFSSTTLEPLIKKVACNYIVSGKLQIHINDRPEIVLDFGNGDCDNKATITVNGVSKEITLRK